jgi:hypothetical protein
MITIKLQGGLGNQMFQYAFARSLSLKTGIPFQIDNLELEQGKDFVKERRYALSVFNVNSKIIDRKEHRYFTQERKHPFLTKIKRHLGIFVPKVVSQASDLSTFDPMSYINEDVYFDGYYQEEGYFIENSETIKNDFKLKVELGAEAARIIKAVESCESVILQVRRGDYATNPKTQRHFALTGKEYFDAGLEYITSKTSKEIELFIVSDDIEWCKSNLNFKFKTNFVSGPDIKDYEEVIIMSKAKHLIISNSTFGWWGAWLNENVNKIVIAPKAWFKNPALKAKVVPEKWIKI